jgi:hypothetical protein
LQKRFIAKRPEWRKRIFFHSCHSDTFEDNGFS